MKQLAIAACLAAAVTLAPLPAGAQTFYVCGMGTVRHVEAVRDTVARQPLADISERGIGPFGTVLRVQTSSSDIRAKGYLVAIQLDDVVYTGRFAHDGQRLDPIRFDINASIPTCIDEDELVFGRPDGRSIRTTIVRTVRVAN
jgi:hypothetical protein